MELLRALGSLIERPTPEHRRIAAALGLPTPPGHAVHGAVVDFQRYPWGSVYLGAEGMMGGEARDRIAGFRRALGMGGEGEADHLAALLALAAALEGRIRRETDPARAALLGEARTTLYWEHLSSWTGLYLASFAGCGSRFHEAWAGLLGAALARIEAGLEFPARLPAALREAPPLADPRAEGGAVFLASVLAPARLGAIVLRDDLARFAAGAGLACRVGERRYVLESFLAQDPGATLRWLAEHVAGWGARMGGRGPDPIARWWSRRAARSAGLLGELAGAAAGGRDRVAAGAETGP